MSIELSETYITLGGEAPITGEPVLIVRCAGCNLDCPYCDSRYAKEVMMTLSEDELAGEIAGEARFYPGIKVLLTGGEPLLGERQHALVRVVRALPHIGFYIETNGSIPIEDFSLRNCSYVVDMKTPSSGFEHSFIDDNLDLLRPESDCIKMVLDEIDLEWAKREIARIRERNPNLPVYLSPQWDRLSLLRLSEFILSNNLPARMSIQLHKMIWGKETRGV